MFFVGVFFRENLVFLVINLFYDYLVLFGKIDRVMWKLYFNIFVIECFLVIVLVCKIMGGLV